MPKAPFLPAQFVPTKFSTAADKAEFGNTFLRFIDEEWKKSLFTKMFYRQLSNTFGHIAHYNQLGFYETWFSNEKDCLAFLKHALRWACHGDPAFTFSDVERAIQHEVIARNYVAQYEKRAAEALRAEELDILRRLEAKYRAPSPPSIEETRSPVPVEASPGITATQPEQGSLF